MREFAIALCNAELQTMSKLVPIVEENQQLLSSYRSLILDVRKTITNPGPIPSKVKTRPAIIPTVNSKRLFWALFFILFKQVN